MNLSDFKDIHKGQRAFIACNGPSLNDVPVGELEGEIVFGLNRGYLKEGLPITYLVTADKKIERAFGDEIKELDCIKFCHNIGRTGGDDKNWIGGDPSRGKNGIFNYEFGSRISTDITKGIRLGHSVTIVALQIAYYMGCNPVYVFGMDHYLTYDHTERVGKTVRVRVEDRDPNHFTDDYFPKDIKFGSQSLSALEKAYEKMYRIYRDNERTLFNTTSHTHLSGDIIPKIELEEVL